MIRRVAIYILLSGWPERDPSRLSVKLASRRGVPAFRLLGTIAWSVLFTFEPRSGRTPGGHSVGYRQGPLPSPSTQPKCVAVGFASRRRSSQRSHAKHKTFFIWNLMVAFISLILSVNFSLWVTMVGNLPALFNPGPRSLGICLIKVSDATKPSYFLASFLTSFLSLFNFFKSSTDIQGMSRAL